MIKRIANLDCIVFALAVSVIVLAMWPKAADRQLVLIRQESGHATYSLAIDDPNLKQLQKRHQVIPRYLPSAELATAKWNHALSDYYASRPASTKASSDVVQAQFIAGQMQDSAPNTDAGEQGFWESEKQLAATQVQVAQRNIELEKQSAKPPKITFGKTISGGFTTLSFLIAAAAALLAVGMFSIWQRSSPEVRLTSAKDGSMTTRIQSPLQTSYEPTMTVNFQPGSLATRQPMSVHVRRLTVAFAVIAAVALLSFK